MRRCRPSGGCKGHTHAIPSTRASTPHPPSRPPSHASEPRPTLLCSDSGLPVSYCSIGPGWWLSPRAKRGLIYHSIAHPSCKITAPLASAASTEVRSEEATHALTQGGCRSDICVCSWAWLLVEMKGYYDGQLAGW